MRTNRVIPAWTTARDGGSAASKWNLRRLPEAKEGTHAAWMPSFPDGMTQFGSFNV